MKKRKLTLKERKLIKAKVAGKSNIDAFREAGYAISPTSPKATSVNASRTINRPHIQKAIEEALDAQGLSPEWAVAQLGKVAAQNDEIGAKRLAAKDILELHGWNKLERPTMQLQVKNAFFQTGRNTNTESEIIDVEAGPTQDAE